MRSRRRVRTESGGESIKRGLQQWFKPVRTVIMFLTAGVALLLLAGACVQQLNDDEAFPGHAFGEGKNNMLDYPQDSGRTEYTGTRLNARFKDQIFATVNEPNIQPIPEPGPSHQTILEEALVEMDSTLQMPGGAAAIEPASLLSGDVELEDVQTPETELEVRPTTQPSQERQRESEVVADSTPTPAWTTGLFLASYRSVAAAEAGWRQINRRYSGVLGELSADVLKVDLGPAKGGIYYRLFAVPLKGEQEARTLCRSLEEEKQFCRLATAGERIKW